MMEGGIRTPAIVRWTGVIKPAVSDGMVHVVDLFTTLAHLGGAKIPSDRPIDGVDQMKLFTGETVKSAREGFPIYVEGQLYGAKWRDWKYHIVWQPGSLKEAKPRSRLNLTSSISLLIRRRNHRAVTLAM